MRTHRSWTRLTAITLALAPLAAATAGDLPYDHHTRMTMKGTIREVKHVDSGPTQGVMLVLETDLEKIDVHLGPATFVDAQPLKLQAGDQVEVLGSWVSLGVPGREWPILVAERVTRGNQVMRLREENGRPLWRRPPVKPS